jgi:hypothetical protein
METRSARYRRMALDDKLRAIRTEDPSKKRAFDQAADEWLKLAEYVEKLERERANLSSPSHDGTA